MDKRSASLEQTATKCIRHVRHHEKNGPLVCSESTKDAVVMSMDGSNDALVPIKESVS